MNLHDDLNDADLKFLKKFGLLGDEDADEAHAPPEDLPEGDEEAPQPEPVEFQIPQEGDTPADEAEVQFEADVAPVEPAEKGEHVHDQEAEKEGFDMAERDAEAEDAEAEAHMEQIYADAEEEIEQLKADAEAAESPAEPEAVEDEGEPAEEAQEEPQAPESPAEAEEGDDGEADSDEADDGEDDPADEQPEPKNEPEPENPEAEEPQMDDADTERDQQDEHHPIAFDIEGNHIFVGSKIVSKADGNFVDENAEPYVAIVLGAWAGSESFENTNLLKRILIVERMGEDDSDSEMVTEDGQAGWAAQSSLTAVVVEDEPEEPETEEEDAAEMEIEPDEEPEPEPEDEREPKADPPEADQAYFVDANGVELFDGNRVRVVSHQNFCDWPDEGIAEVVMATRNGVTNPGLLPQNFKDESLGSWKSYDGKPVFAIGWGNTLDGIVKYERTDDAPEPKPEQPEAPKPEAPEQPEDEQPEDVEPPEAQDDEDADFEAPPADEDERKPMTKAQRDRFVNLAARIFAKAEGSFGKTKQSAETGPLLPGGVFDGEEVAQVMEVRSNGVIYRITLSAERIE